jgi:chromosome partitioning protein
MAMTMYDSRTHLALQVVEEVAKHFPELVFHTVIPRTVRIAEAPSYGEPLVSFDPRSRGAQAYEELTKELLAREAASKTEDGGRRTKPTLPSSVARPPSGS